MTLIEITVAMVVIAVAAMGSVSWTLSGMNLEVLNRETADATDTMRQLVEELQGAPFRQLFARFNAEPNDDPDGPGTALGGLFGIAAHQSAGFLRAAPPAPPPGSGIRSRHLPMTVEIQFPVDESGVLTESVTDPAWGGRGWDLNADGVVAAGDRKADYRVLPVRIRLTWNGARGARSLVVTRFLTGRD